MGRCKATLEFQGQRLMDRMARIAERAGYKPHFVLKETQRFNSDRHPIVRETDPNHHPLTGIACALTHCTDSYALILPCDTPFLKPRGLQLFAEQQRPTIAYSNRIHPLIGWYPTSWSEKANSMAKNNEPAAKFAKGTFYLYLPHEELHNCNRPEDL